VTRALFVRLAPRAPALASALALAASVAAPRPSRAQDLAPPPPMSPSGQPASPYGSPYTTPPSSPYTNAPYTSSPYTNAPGAPMSATTQTLDASEREDSGRGLEFFYVSGGVSLSTLGFETLGSDKLGVAKSSGVGPEIELGLGLRLLVFTIGPRVRYHALSSFNLWQIDGEAALHVPIGKIDAYFGLHGGYAFVGSLGQDAVASAPSNVSTSDARPRGFDVGLQLGVDYYLSSWFSVGGEVAGNLLFLRRSAVSSATDPTFGSSGSGAGLGGMYGVHTGLHF